MADLMPDARLVTIGRYGLASSPLLLDRICAAVHRGARPNRHARGIPSSESWRSAQEVLDLLRAEGIIEGDGPTKTPSRETEE